MTPLPATRGGQDGHATGVMDLLVVGGGPAGLAVAIEARRAGMEVAVFEPRPTPIDKACGEGLMPTGVRRLERLGVEVRGHPLHGIRYVDEQHTVEADFPDGRGMGVRRTDLHAALSRRARELGVPVIEERVTRVSQTAREVVAGGRRARWLVAADGLHSPLRRYLGLERPARRSPRYGLRRHYQVRPWTDHVEVHVGSRGEAYVTPLAADLVGVALLGPPGDYEAGLMAFPALRGRLTGSAVTSVRGAGPLRQRVVRRVAGRVLLVGDAAGYVDALTGEGIALSLTTAAALVAALRADRPQLYEQDWRRLTRRHRFITEALVASRGTALSGRLLVPAAARLPWAFRRVVAALA